jgi:hypothetical protein
MRFIIYVVFSILLLNSLGYVNSQTSVGVEVTSISSTSNYSEKIQDVDLSNLGSTPFQQTVTVVSIFVKQPPISASAPFCNYQNTLLKYQNSFISQPNKSLFSQSSI